MINRSLMNCLMNGLMNRPMAAALLGALMFGQSAGAADALPEPLRACAAMRNDIERLACYDKAVAHIESGSVAAVPGEYVRRQYRPGPCPENRARNQRRGTPADQRNRGFPEPLRRADWSR